MFSLLAFCSVHVATINIEEGGGILVPWAKGVLEKKNSVEEKKGKYIGSLSSLAKGADILRSGLSITLFGGKICVERREAKKILPFLCLRLLLFANV